MNPIRFFRTKTMRDIGLLLLLPIVIAAVNSNWLYSPVNIPRNRPFQDHWFYLANFRYLPLYANQPPMGEHYFIERLSWNLPGYAAYQTFSPVVANGVLHLAVYCAAVLGLYGALHMLFGRKPALLAAVLMGSYSWFLRAAGWDYVDGVSIAYFMLATFFLVAAVKQERWRAHMIAAGIMTACLLVANLFWFGFAPAALVLFLSLNRQFHRRNILRCALYFIAGGLFAAAAFAIVNFAMTGDLFFLRTSIRGAGEIASAAFLTDILHRLYGGMRPDWHWLPVFLCGASVVAIMFGGRRRATPRYRVILALIAHFALSYLWLIVFHLTSQPFLIIFLYCSTLLPSAFLLLGGLLSDVLDRMGDMAYDTVVLGVVSLALAPFVLVALQPTLLNLQAHLVLVLAAGFVLMTAVAFRGSPSAFAVCAAVVLIGFVGGYDAAVFVPDRSEGQANFAALFRSVEFVDALYPTVRHTDFALMYDPAQTDQPYVGIGAMYFDLWSKRRILFRELPGTLWFFENPLSTVLNKRDAVLMTRSPDTMTRLANTVRAVRPPMHYDVRASVEIGEGSRRFTLYVLRFSSGPERSAYNVPLRPTGVNVDPEPTGNGGTAQLFWTGGGSDVSMEYYLDVPETDIDIELCGNMSIVDLGETLLGSVNSEPIAFSKQDSTEQCPLFYMADVPRAVIANRSLTTLAVTIPTAPADDVFHNGDKRRLGMAIRSISFNTQDAP